MHLCKVILIISLNTTNIYWYLFVLTPLFTYIRCFKCSQAFKRFSSMLFYSAYFYQSYFICASQWFQEYPSLSVLLPTWLYFCDLISTSLPGSANSCFNFYWLLHIPESHISDLFSCCVAMIPFYFESWWWYEILWYDMSVIW